VKIVQQSLSNMVTYVKRLV